MCIRDRYKPVHCIPQAAGVCGKVDVLDIGIPEAVLYASLRGSAEITKASVQSLSLIHICIPVPYDPCA